jgi:hypothetical protein
MMKNCEILKHPHPHCKPWGIVEKSVGFFHIGKIRIFQQYYANFQDGSSFISIWVLLHPTR